MGGLAALGGAGRAASGAGIGNGGRAAPFGAGAGTGRGAGAGVAAGVGASVAALAGWSLVFPHAPSHETTNIAVVVASIIDILFKCIAIPFQACRASLSTH